MCACVCVFVCVVNFLLTKFLCDLIFLFCIIPQIYTKTKKVAWISTGSSLIFRALGVGPELQSQATWPLRVLCLLALPVTVRSYCSGFCNTNKRTDLLASSSAARICGVAAACLFLPLFFSDGALLGALSLLVGFTAEAAATARGAWKLRNILLSSHI